ncbi:hypothetical protein BC826DRAFT_23588 [Russula brevipes]|nr:hypothetical protein BC826DRAFT_23588 [Russula brevipes]
MTKWEDQLTSNEISPLSLEARDEDYDTYLFWPSLGNWMDSKSFVATHQSVIVIIFVPIQSSPLCPLAHVPPVRPSRLLSRLGHHTFSASCPPPVFCHEPWNHHAVQSPPSLTPPDFRFPPPREDQTPGGALPGARGGGVQKKDLFPRYSNIFRMGLLMVRSYSLGQLVSYLLLKQRATRFVDRAVQAVRATLCKAKPRGQALKRAHAFDS